MLVKNLSRLARGEAILEVGRKFASAGLSLYTPSGRAELIPPIYAFYSRYHTEGGPAFASIECAWEQRVHWAACHSFYCGYRAAVKVLTAVEGVSTFGMIPHTLLLEYHLGYTKSYDQTEQQHIDR